MFSYMVELNDAESFLVGYSNYETVQKLKNVKRRLSQQMVMNDTLFFDYFWLFRSIIGAAEVSALRSNFLMLTLFRSLLKFSKRTQKP